MKNLTLILALGLLTAGCAGSGGGSSGGGASAIIPGGPGSTPGFSSSISVSRATPRLPTAVCINANGMVSGTGYVKAQIIDPSGCSFSSDEKMLINADGTFERTFNKVVSCFGNATAKITGKITLDPVTRKAMLTNMHSTTTGSTVEDFAMEAVGAVGVNFSKTRIGYTITNGATIPDQSVDYYRMSTDSGIGLLTTDVGITGDATSKCYIYFQ